MNAESDIKLKKYKVIKTYFELNNNFVSEKKPININPTFSRKINKINASHFQIELSVSISENSENVNIPFFANATILGEFQLNEWENDDLIDFAMNNCTAILFPYLRNLLSSVTLNGNVPPYHLPIINVTKLFKKE